MRRITVYNEVCSNCGRIVEEIRGDNKIPVQPYYCTECRIRWYSDQEVEVKMPLLDTVEDYRFRLREGQFNMAYLNERYGRRWRMGFKMPPFTKKWYMTPEELKECRKVMPQ